MGSEDFFSFMFDLICEPFVVNFYAFLLIWSVIFATLVWLAEHRVNPKQFPPRFLNGIDDALWWAFVTITTVGYGDKTPISPAGRVVAVLWMMFGLSLFSMLTGHMGSRFYALTHQAPGIESAYALAGLRVCGYPVTFAQWYIPSSIEVTPVIGANIVECGALLKDGLVDAVVMEHAFMAYWATNDPWATQQPIQISSPIAVLPMGILFGESERGLAVKTWLSPLLLELFDDSYLHDLQAEWFKTSVITQPALFENTQWVLVGPALALIAAYLLLIICQVWFTSCFNKGVQSASSVASIVRAQSAWLPSGVTAPKQTAAAVEHMHSHRTIGRDPGGDFAEQSVV